MNIEISKKMLKVLGIINLILGILFIVIGLVGIGMSTALQVTISKASNFLLISFIALCVGIVTAFAGYCDIKAANDISRIMPAWILSIVGLIYIVTGSFIDLFQGPIEDPIIFIRIIISIIISILTFIAANSVLKLSYN